MFKIWKEPAKTFGVPVWNIYCDGYLYMAEDLTSLLRQFLYEYKHDKHLVG